MRSEAGEIFRSLSPELRTLFARGVAAPLGEPAFDDLALRVFRYQLDANEVYRRFCEGRGATADSVTSWREIPAVPTTAFKHLRLVSAPGRAPQAVFRTSGTSRGRGARGEHVVADMGLYRASALPGLAARVVPGTDGRTGSLPGKRPGGDHRIPFLCLLPSPAEAPDSSLSAMAGFAVERWGDASSGWFVDPASGLRVEALRRALEVAAAGREPVVVLGTAFSLVHWIDGGGAPVKLPEGSRIMETGGFKGRSRSVDRAELYGALYAALGVPPARIVNEYGMTELLSQFYEPVLGPPPALGGRAPAEPSGRWHVGPPWVRTRVLDPRTLEPVTRGEPGLLCHLDLANLGSVASVLTEDVGVEVDGGFRVMGRAEGAEPRGCSLAMEELAEAAGGR